MRLTVTQRETRGRRKRTPGFVTPNRHDPTGTKRRLADEGGPALKLFLSEDAVATRLQRLSLDNDHSYVNCGFPKMPSQQDPLSREMGDPELPDDQEDEESVLVDPGEFCMSNNKVLSVCPLLEETLRDSRPADILPESLLHSLSSPRMELVLWSPPSSHIQKLIRSLTGLLDPPSEKPRSANSASGETHEDHMEL